LAAKLGVDVQAGDEDIPAEDLMNTLMERAKAGGKTDAEISAALEEWGWKSSLLSFIKMLQHFYFIIH